VNVKVLHLQIILDFPDLQILYLHGNAISDMKEVEKLTMLKNLKKLSLHGNPLENEKVRYMKSSLKVAQTVILPWFTKQPLLK